MDHEKVTPSEATNFKDTPYAKWIHRFGRRSTAIALLFLYSVPFFSGILTGTTIDFKMVLLSLVSLLPFIVLAATETLAYAPIMASSGSYIGYVTGRVNVCFGPIGSQLEKHNIPPNSKNHEIVASIVVGVMSLTGVVLMFLALLFINLITPILENPIFQPGYDNMVYAMVGGFAVPLLLKGYKLATAPLIIVTIMVLLLGSAFMTSMQSIILPIMLVVGLIVNFILFKKNKLGN